MRLFCRVFQYLSGILQTNLYYRPACRSIVTAVQFVDRIDCFFHFFGIQLYYIVIIIGVCLSVGHTFCFFQRILYRLDQSLGTISSTGYGIYLCTLFFHHLCDHIHGTAEESIVILFSDNQNCLQSLFLDHNSNGDISVISFCGSIVDALVIRECSCNRCCTIVCIFFVFRICSIRTGVSSVIRRCSLCHCCLAQCIPHRLNDSVGTEGCTGYRINTISTLCTQDPIDHPGSLLDIFTSIIGLHNLNITDLSTVDHNFYFQISGKSCSGSIIGSIFISCRFLYASYCLRC